MGTTIYSVISDDKVRLSTTNKDDAEIMIEHILNYEDGDVYLQTETIY